MLKHFQATPDDVWNGTENVAEGPDYDFGASPNLIKGEDGPEARRRGAEVGHLLGARPQDDEAGLVTMTGPGAQVGGIIGSTAWDGDRVYGPDTVGGEIWALDTGGSYNWISADGGPARFNPVSVSNGVVYTTDMNGHLTARDADTRRRARADPDRLAHLGRDRHRRRVGVRGRRHRGRDRLDRVLPAAQGSRAAASRAAATSRARTTPTRSPRGMAARRGRRRASDARTAATTRATATASPRSTRRARSTQRMGTAARTTTSPVGEGAWSRAWRAAVTASSRRPPAPPRSRPTTSAPTRFRPGRT